MEGTPDSVTLTGRRVVLREVEPADVAELVRIRRTPGVRRWWGDVDTDLAAGWPFDDPDTICFAVLVAGRLIGLIQYAEENEPRYRHAGIDIFLDPDVHARGYGREAVEALARHLVRNRGHHRLVIDPAADNAAAIRAYAAVGFRAVGLMRDYERDVDTDSWHDGLLMDLLARDTDW
jgi:RimJ/RimL family protein N-acetyltransferase